MTNTAAPAKINADDVTVTHGGQRQAMRDGHIVAVTNGRGQWLAWPDEQPCDVDVLPAHEPATRSGALTIDERATATREQLVEHYRALGHDHALAEAIASSDLRRRSGRGGRW
jgi:hypothetical protein